MTADAAGPVHGTSGAICDPSLTYANFGRQFFSDNCLRCHSSAGGPAAGISFETHMSIRQRLSEIDQQAAGGPARVNRMMPLDRQIDDELRAELGAWIACGAP